jgi:hypothetical protein
MYSDRVCMKANNILLTVQKYINNQQIDVNIYYVFCSQYCHQHVSSGIPAIFRMMLLLLEENSG